MDQPYQQNNPDTEQNPSASIPPNAWNAPPEASTVPPVFTYPPPTNPYAPPTYYPPVYTPPAKPIRHPATGRDIAFAVVCAIFCILCADNYLWGGSGLGASLSTIGLILTGIFYLGRHVQKITFYGIICVLAYLACAASLSFTDAGGTKLLVILMMIPLSAASILEFMDIRSHLNGDFHNIADLFYAVFALTFGKIGNTFYMLFHKTGNEGAVGKRKTGSVILGLVISLPALLIIIPLLKSSDIAFSSLMDQFSPKNLSEFFAAGLIGLSLFILIFGRMAASVHISRPVCVRQRNSGLEPALIATFLSVISAVYLLYLFSQLSYFFSAFSGFLPRNFTVAEYARRGFFEMTAVCIFNLLIIFLANLLCRKEAGKAPLSVRLLSVFFCIFSLALAATSFSKVYLYIQRFGMTRLRITTTIFIVFLAVVFITVIFRLLIQKVPYIKIALAAAALLLVATAFLNVDRVIAKYNVEAYLSGHLESIDMDTISELDSDAITPYLLRLTDDENSSVSSTAKRILTQKATDLFEIENGRIVKARSSLRSWNLCTASAEKLLDRHFDQYYDSRYVRSEWD